MKPLSKDWITEKTLDFEYKKYVLLSYLQAVSKEFKASKLYPTFPDIIEQYHNLNSIKEGKKQLSGQFQQRITGIDWVNLRFTYSAGAPASPIQEELEQILDFSIPLIKKHIEEGKNIYQYIENNLRIEPIGVLPLQTSEGYLFIREKEKKEARVYRYQVSIFEQAREKYRGIHTSYLKSYRLSLANTYEGIKRKLIQENKDLPNPATFTIESAAAVPLHESLFPVAKRLIVKYFAHLETDNKIHFS